MVVPIQLEQPFFWIIILKSAIEGNQTLGL